MRKRKKTSDEVVQMLKDLHEDDPRRYTPSVLARMFNLSVSAVSRILRGERRKKKDD